MSRKAWLVGVLVAGFAVTCGAFAYRGMLRGYAAGSEGFKVARLDVPVTRGEVFGLEIGRSTLAEVKGFVAERGFYCSDASMSKMMAAMKAKQPEVDAVSSASAKKRAARKTNPQVRLSCAAASAKKLDAGLPDSTGRLLFVFDAPDAPLRSVSYQRTYPNHDLAAGLADARGTLAHLGTSYGDAGLSQGGFDAEPGFLAPVAREWRFEHLAVNLSAVRYPKSGLVISQDVSVPVGQAI
jgi:hypothetical protein